MRLFLWEIFGEIVNKYNVVKTEQIHFLDIICLSHVINFD
jgi:hypothetical protein